MLPMAPSIAVQRTLFAKINQRLLSPSLSCTLYRLLSVCVCEYGAENRTTWALSNSPNTESLSDDIAADLGRCL